MAMSMLPAASCPKEARSSASTAWTTTGGCALRCTRPRDQHPAQFGFLFVGMDRGMPAGLASLVLQAQALFTALFAVFLLGERPALRQWAGMATALAGLTVIGFGRAATVPLVALALVLAAAACWGAGNIATRIARPRSGLQLIVWASLIPPVPLAVMSLLVDGVDANIDALTNWSWSGLAALAYLVMLATLVGFGTWAALLRHYPASTVAPFSLLVPVVGIATAWAVLGEVPGRAELVGALIVLVGLLLLNSVAPSGGRPADPAVATEVAADAVLVEQRHTSSTNSPETVGK
jgi:O-acetylserine/cysteine efflux transporter